MDEPDTDIRRAARAAWAKLIYRVYEGDPLKCINGDQEMWIVALIHDPAVIWRILEHLKLWDPEPMPRGPPEDPEVAEPPDWPVKRQLPLEYCPVPDIA